jgi:hypothetical protein
MFFITLTLSYPSCRQEITFYEVMVVWIWQVWRYMDKCLHLAFSVLAYFPYFEKIKVGLWDHVAVRVFVCVRVCVCVFPLIDARQRLGKSPLIVARQRLRKNLPIVARQRICKNPSIVAMQRFGKNPPIVARQRLGRNVTAVTNTDAKIEELLEASFSMWPCRLKESRD